MVVQLYHFYFFIEFGSFSPQLQPGEVLKQPEQLETAQWKCSTFEIKSKKSQN